MIKTPLSTMIGGAFWTPKATILGGTSKTFDQLIKSLFANGEQGFAYDPNDLSTMFQDAAGTVPVTGAGQPVGLILDKSGRDNHARQTTSASRPILRQNANTGAYYLEFDGVNDFLRTANIDFSGAPEATVVAGFLTPRLDVRQMIIEHGGNPITELGAFSLEAPTTVFNNVGIRAKPTTEQRVCAVGITQNTAYVVTASIVSNIRLKIGVYGDTSREIPFGRTTFRSTPMFIGRGTSGVLTLQAHIYSLIGVGRLTTESEIAYIEKELARRTGVTLGV